MRLSGLTTLSTLLIIGVLASCSSGTEKKEASEEVPVEEPVLGSDAEIKDGQSVFFVNLEDGAIMSNPVSVEMGVNGMEIEPAGERSLYKGHHHIIVDGAVIKKGDVVPTDSTHLHFGLGQTSTELNLPPGEHTLTLQFADGFHLSYGEKMSATISITIQE